jgi:hypothetical protein
MRELSGGHMYETATRQLSESECAKIGLKFGIGFGDFGSLGFEAF